jgi:hypothetical protein
MLMLSSLSPTEEQEAIMTPVKALPKTSPVPSKVTVADYSRPTSVPADRKSSPEITHAWSIGVTDAGRFAQPERRQETCPPEVYIG